MRGYLGIDIGSISTKGALLGPDGGVLAWHYLRTRGDPINAVKRLLRQLQRKTPRGVAVAGCGTTGSARRLAGVMLGADAVKNEIIAHAEAAACYHPEARTILEIGGQDSKIIILDRQVPVDFAMNTVCAAGTGSFLDHQAARLGVPITRFGALALRARHRVTIAGRCTVFAESDMIHKAQLGNATEDIAYGLCEAIVRNYLNTVAKGKAIRPQVLFQGGVAANAGVRKAFEAALGLEVTVPEHFLVMGAIGAALIARDETRARRSRFAGFATAAIDFGTRAFECEGCPNRCEVIETRRTGTVIDRHGDRCGKWSEV